MKKYYNKVLTTIAFLSVSLYTYSQVSAGTKDNNPIITALPSLTIAPEARGGGMGDIGAATVPDVFSQHWNPAKYAFSTSAAGVGVSYTPWLSKIVDDIALIYAAGYYKFGSEGNQAVSASIRYFKIGDIIETDEWGVLKNTVNPYEMAIDIGYSRKLTETFSGAVTLRYMRADYPSSDDDSSSPGNAFAADVSGYNESYIMLGQVESLLGLGFSISNIGSKISVDGGENSYFIPTNLRLGGSLTYPLDDYNTLAFNVDLNKLLVPTRPIDEGQGDEKLQQEIDDYNDLSPISGIFKSFGDAPGGFSEELKEINWSIGAEYTYDNKFSIRGGYFNEDKTKGNRKYFSFGAGVKLSSFQIDASYLIATESTNPLDQTLRFSIGFDMDGLRNLFK